MEWVLRSPQLHTIFSNLGYLHADGYHVNENCNAALEGILENILSEDKTSRTYRRSISFGENVRKDLIPLLIHAKEDKTIELLTKILVNLTIPIECLVSVDVISKNDSGRHTIFEMNNLLLGTKIAFTDLRATRVIIDFMKKNADSKTTADQKMKLLPDQCTNVSNGLLLLRNILHIPENRNAYILSYSGPTCPTHTVQNQILWNIFSQSIDKVLMKLVSLPDASYWGVSMIQFIALMYKDQNVTALHKLVNVWLEGSTSESSEDNESNTPPDRGSDNSSPMLTSEPTSDSSDAGKSNDRPNSGNRGWQASSDMNTIQNKKDKPTFKKNEKHAHAKSIRNTNLKKYDDTIKLITDTDLSSTSGIQSDQSVPAKKKGEKKTKISEASDCGYGTQIENHESISTSSNDDELPFKKPVHHKPHHPKQRPNTKVRIGSLQERKRKKVARRGKSSIINVHGLTHKTPTDEDIANVLKEFTVDFLLKGYNSLVYTLHHEILTNPDLEIDTSHFFWLVTYFLRFASQVELELHYVGSVLTFDMAAYLAAEAVNLCEQFDLALKVHEHNLAPTIKRLHLAVTAIREFVQGIYEFKKLTGLSDEDREALVKLQIKMCNAEEIRSVFVLLIRHYNPEYQTKQYLQDLIIANHILLMFMDNTTKLPQYNGSTSMVEHMKQFATPDMMYQYGILLEDYNRNGEFVNDCIFTVMHHVGGLDSFDTMYQPTILKTFTSMWKTEFEICDDWNDVVECVLNTFSKKPSNLPTPANFMITADSCDDELLKAIGITPSQTRKINEIEAKKKLVHRIASDNSDESWTEDEISALSWMYLQCNSEPDAIGEIVKLLKEDGITKSNDSVVKELYKQNMINKDEYKKLTKGESYKATGNAIKDKETQENDISKLFIQLAEDGKSKSLEWVQKVLLETCYVKIYLEKKKEDEAAVDSSKLLNFEVFKKKAHRIPVMSSVAYHALMLNQSVPLVTWNCHQATFCKDLKFLQLMHKLGFYMPVDSGKIFIRIPHIWTADFMYEVAGKLGPIDTTNLKFSVDEFARTSAMPEVKERPIYPTNMTAMRTDNQYQVHKLTSYATMVNFTPMPGCSYNSEASELDNNNWLKVIQKSQELKLSLKTKSFRGIVEDMELAAPLPLSPPPLSPPPLFLKPEPVAVPAYVPFMNHSLRAGRDTPLRARRAAPMMARGVAPTMAGGVAPMMAGGVAPMMAGGVAPMMAGGVAPMMAGGVAPMMTGGVPPMMAGGVAPMMAGGVAPMMAGGVAPMMAGGVAPMMAGGVAPMMAGGVAPMMAGGVAPMMAGGVAPMMAGDVAPLIIPTIMTVKQEISTFSLHDNEHYNNSVCETASVVSDLTRMYVSDEDEKTDGTSPVKPTLPDIDAEADTDDELDELELDSEPEELDSEPEEPDSDPEEPDWEPEGPKMLEGPEEPEPDSDQGSAQPSKRPRFTFSSIF